MSNINLKRTAGLIAGMSLATVAQAADYTVSITNLTRGMHFTPLIGALHAPSAAMFQSGHQASAELQAIAEGGDTSGMGALLESIGANIANGTGLIAPGETVTLSLSNNGAAGNSVFSLTSMLLPTNDGFVGLNSVHLPDSGSVTYHALGYDAGTEANDELVGSGAPGQPGFPAPPPIVATGTGTGGSGVQTTVEGFVHVHKNTIGDLDATGGVSDINQAVHGWLNPVASITITNNGGTGPTDNGPGAAQGLSGQVYSATALEIFWQAANAGDAHISGYDIYRNGDLVETRDARSFFDDGLNADTEYTYSIKAVDINGNRGDSVSVTLRTSAH